MTTLSTSLILASGSLARRVLLEESGLTLHLRPVDVNEEDLRKTCEAEGKSLGQTAIILADAKALKAADAGLETDFIIAADQILDLDGIAFAKPKTLEEAKHHLRALRGRTHRLQTAVVLYRGMQKIWANLAVPELTMREFSEVFLETYLEQEGEALLGCVGAYRLEGLGVQLFSRIVGDHDAVLGLQRLPLLQALRAQKIILT
ncbi:Maf family protein [Gluconobacter japonicus]|uniref:Nucleoside triphosphate pyrophosphatase n=1 Tax=Gluconobacter japonicus TaxID=376620 RepID=A0ABQ5WFP9_GLUJA|nr:Maf family protein [Gluconobacter japonicus]KXV25316.1 septum formation protein Maf [Gluconobacter japonicus]GLQ58941.1 Maf-like protein [Gluconobacter japonicus]